MPRRLAPTLADYLVILVSPVLIMTMVGSLVYFLVEILYQGPYPASLLYILTLFVIAAVLIGRIAIESSTDRAVTFALPLAVATGLTVHRFAAGQSGPAAWALLALIWWSTHRLTWDCTFLDESEDVSNQGLVETAGAHLGRREHLAAPPPLKPPDPILGPSDEPAEPDGVTSPKPAPRAAWWQAWLDRRQGKNAPGVWIVYFSLAALPLFGIGQRFIPEDDAERRQYAFAMLGVYVASGMALLMCTSFLGLRRYLRQRRLQMPGPMAGLWVATGGALIVAILLGAAMVPRPAAEYALAKPPWQSDPAARDDDPRASRHSLGKDGVRDQQAPPAKTRNESPPKRPPADQPSQSPAKSRSEPAPESGGPAPPPRSPGLLEQLQRTFGSLGKWLVYLAALMAVGGWLWVHREGLLAEWRRLLSDLRALWERFFGSVKGERREVLREIVRPPLPPRAFSEFADPFATGEAGRMSPAELVRYCFAALEAWGRDHGHPRPADDTPHEYAQRIGEFVPPLARGCWVLADLYCRAAYAPGTLSARQVRPLEQFWEELLAAPVAAADGLQLP